MFMLIRPARKGDAPAISGMLTPWFDFNPTLEKKFTDLIVRNSLADNTFCNVLEANRKVVCVSFWQSNPFREIDLLAIHFSRDERDQDIIIAFLEHEIVEWSKRKCGRIIFNFPESVDDILSKLLKKLGFMFESVFHRAQFRNAIICMTKTLCHETVGHSGALDFLKQKFLELGYEIMPEATGFSYRTREPFLKPFLIGSWHRVIASGNDIIIYPPAKKIETHELETMFYPLRIARLDDTPILVTLEKKRACSIINIPREDWSQRSILGEDSELLSCPLNLSNTTYSIASGHKSLRKGLPVLFYVNRLGAVGEARIIDWSIETVSNLFRNIENFPGIQPDDVDLLETKTCSKITQVLKITYNYYRSFNRIISYEDIRAIDPSFNPQRRRFISNDIFESISALGSQ